MSGGTDQPTVVVLDPDGRLGPIAASIERGGVDGVRRVETVESIDRKADCVLVSDGPETDEHAAIDGVEMVERVRAHRADVPVGVYTFRAGREPIESTLGSGADTVIRVPPSRSTVLASRVRRLAGVDRREPRYQQFESLLEHYPGVVYLKDLESRFVDVTQHTFEEHEDSPQLDRETVIGLTDYELYDRAVADELFEEEQELLARERSVVEKITHVAEDGQDRWLSTTKVPRYDENGELLGLVGEIRDVTDIKRQERMIATLHEASRGLIRADSKHDIGAIAVDIATKIESLPRARVDLFDKEGSSLREVAATSDEQFDWDHETFVQVANSGTTHYRSEIGELIAVEKHDSDSVELSESVCGLRIPLGQHGVLGLESDGETLDPFTVELAQVLAANVEAALDRAYQQRRLAEQAERLEEFALLGSHELRNRLQIALGTAERAHAQGDVDAVGDVIETLGRMERLVSQLLTLARTGAVSQTTQTVALSGIANAAWKSVDGDATLTVEPDGIVTANRDGLLEVFEMLFRAAVDGGQSDTVSVGTTADGFYVEEGVSILTDEQEEIFEPTREGVDAATGDSIYLISVIADAHNWEVNVSERPDAGTRFVFANVEVKQVT